MDLSGLKLQGETKFMNKLILVILILIASVADAQSVRTLNADYIDGNNSGFRNYAVNPYFDKNLAGVTCTSFATCALTTTEKLQGTQSLSLTATSASGTVKLRAKAFDRELYGQNCEFSVDVFTSATAVPHYDVYLENNGTQVSGTTTAMVEQSNRSQRYRVNAPCGSSTDGPYDLVIDSNNTTGTNIKLDNFYAGLARNVGPVAQAEWVGAITIAGASNCIWNNNNTGSTFLTFAADSDCGAQAVAGQAQAPGTKIPGLILPSIKPGVYMFQPAGNFFSDSAGTCTFRISDGTNASNAFGIGATSAGSTPGSAYINYTAGQGSTTFTIQSNSITTTGCQIRADAAGTQFKLDVYYFPTSSQNAVRMDQSDTNCIPYTPTYTGFGTVTVSSACSRRDGQFLEGFVTFTSGTSTAVEGRVSLGFGGVSGNVTADTSVVAAASVVGMGGISIINSNEINSLMPASNQTYINLGVNRAGSTNSVVPANGNQIANSGEVVKFFYRVPIVGWTTNQNAPLLVGGVTSGSAGLTRIEHITFSGGTSSSNCTSSPCTTYVTSGAFGTVTRTSTGLYTVPINSGVFSSAPSCTITGGAVCLINTASAVSSTNIPILCSVPGTGPVDAFNVNITCVGPR
jgi:hypothetical protein